MANDPSSFRQREYAGERDMEEFWKELKPKREPIGWRFFLPIVIGLVVLSVPWYRSTGEVGTLIGGLPIWIWVTLACSTGLAIVTAYVALRHWDDDLE
ncbi:MAG: hypothetical protein VYE73_10970 [Acidobacteriota bacterium]|nr:hypothetical protein [Acidobacteriota bacterium]